MEATNRRHWLQRCAEPGRGRRLKVEPDGAVLPWPCPQGKADAGVGAEWTFTWVWRSFPGTLNETLRQLSHSELKTLNVYLTWQIPCGPFSPSPLGASIVVGINTATLHLSIQLESSSCLTQNMISPISSGLLMTMQWVGWSLCFQAVPKYLNIYAFESII